MATSLFNSPPASLRALGLRGSAGLLLVFLLPRANFAQVNTTWQGLAKAGLSAVTISSAGALCSHKQHSIYCAADSDEGSWLWLPGGLVQQHEIHAVDLHTRQASTARQRVAAIRQELQRLPVRMPLSAEHSFALVFCDGTSASEGFLMQAWYASGRFPCLAVGGSAGEDLAHGATDIGTHHGVLQQHALVILCSMAKGTSFAPFKTQSFKATEYSWLIAEADPVAREVRSVFNDQAQTQSLVEVLCAHFRCATQQLSQALQNHSFAVEGGRRFFYSLHLANHSRRRALLL